MNNVMIDLETLGISTSPVLLSIGAVRFDAYGLKDEFYLKVSADSGEKVGLLKDQSTIDWWNTQDPTTRAEAFSGTIELRDALIELSIWLGPEAVIWGNGACSDNIWLKSAYAACNLPTPWDFWNDRCYRTTRALFKHERVEPEIAHHALSDAKAQALTLINIAKDNKGLKL